MKMRIVKILTRRFGGYTDVFLDDIQFDSQKARLDQVSTWPGE